MDDEEPAAGTILSRTNAMVVLANKMNSCDHNYDL